MALHPTKTRLSLLRAVHAGDVVDGPDEHGEIHTWLIDPPYVPVKVNSRIWDALQAGWVEHPGHEWRLTDAGRAIVGGAP